MIQQINLYQDVLKSGQNQSVINNLVISIIVVIALIAMLSIYFYMDLNATEKKLHSVKKQLTETEVRIQQLQIQYPDRQINTLLIQEIAHVQKLLSSLSQVISVLTDKTSVQNQGFSQYFSALARQSIPEVWLNTIIINTENNQLQFKGSSYNPEKIPVLLQKWHQEPVFQGKDFAQLSLLQAEENENQIDFIVSSKAGILKGTGHE